MQPKYLLNKGITFSCGTKAGIPEPSGQQRPILPAGVANQKNRIHPIFPARGAC